LNSFFFSCRNYEVFLNTSTNLGEKISKVDKISLPLTLSPISLIDPHETAVPCSTLRTRVSSHVDAYPSTVLVSPNDPLSFVGIALERRSRVVWERVSRAAADQKVSAGVGFAVHTQSI